MGTTLYVEFDLTDVITNDLISELENRYLDELEKEALLDCINDDDSNKMKLFLQVQNRYSVQELQELFKEDLSVSSSTNQIKLF